ncbi:MAG: DUF6702 family protein [Bacteroidota bacterium]
MYLLQLCLGLVLCLPTPAHDYHISKTNLRYVAAASEVQVEMHLFVDDLEADMAGAGAPNNLEIGTEQENEEAERYLKNYLGKHFQVEWNGKKLPLSILGYELEDDLHGLWIYLSCPVTAGPEHVEVFNTLLVATYPDQKNITKIFDGVERSTLLLTSKDQPSAKL